MKYKGKLFIAFTSVVFVSTFSALGIFYIKSKELVFEHIRSQIFSVGQTASETLNGNYIATINSKADTTTPEYARLIQQLRHIRDLNRDPHFYIYTLCIYKQIGPNIVYIADAQENPKLAAYFGEPFYLDPNEKDYNPTVPFVDSSESKDQWGDWLSGMFPIYNDQHQIVAHLEIDIYYSRVLQSLKHLLWYAAIGFAASLLVGFIIARILSKKMSKDLDSICKCVEAIATGNLEARTSLHSKDEIAELGNAINDMAKQLQEKERMKVSFGKYVSSYVLDKIVKTESVAQLEGETKKITVLFSDIRNFTTLSEFQSPTDVVAFLNNYFEKMIEIIFKHQGTLDKFIGDGMMVEFGAPLDDPNQEYNAVVAAIKMQQMVKALCLEWKGTKYENIKVGIGIHTGTAVIGNIGSSQRMEFTAIGDTVNVASRLEFATKETQKDIIISEATYNAIKDHAEIKCEQIGPISLKGRAEPVISYSVSPESELPLEKSTTK